MGSALEVQRRLALKQDSNKPRQSPKRRTFRADMVLTIGVDLGDKNSRYCALNKQGEVVAEGSVGTTRKAIVEKFQGLPSCRVALEVGTHSPWVSRLLAELGHEVLVANARQVKLISESSRKTDRIDAEMLARMARADPSLLRPIRHRSAETQAVLTKVRVRATLVETRTSLINTVRSLAKVAGERVPACAADSLGMADLKDLPAEMQQTLEPLVRHIESLTEAILKSEKELAQIARRDYPETEQLQQIKGVGTLIALTYVLTVEDAGRFKRSRDVGCYVGLRPKRSQSGERSPELPISKEGDIYLRRLLVQGAHYILSRLGPDTDLKRWGVKLAARGGKNAHKRAVVAVARKLSILLHRLWVSGEVYEPLRNHRAPAA